MRAGNRILRRTLPMLPRASRCESEPISTKTRTFRQTSFRHSTSRCQGFTLIACLAAMFLLALATQGVMQVLSQQAQREREADLLRAGESYARAIGTYYESSPGSVKRFPPSLKDLIEDKRFVTLKRHLRALYTDPITRTAEWGLIRSNDGGISGVYSTSQGQPLKTSAVELESLKLASASRYSDWRFEYIPNSTSNGIRPKASLPSGDLSPSRSLLTARP